MRRHPLVPFVVACALTILATGWHRSRPAHPRGSSLLRAKTEEDQAVVAAAAHSEELPATAAEPLEDPLVEFDCGLARGFRSEGGAVVEFRGIPYGAPPVGARRWRAPAAADCWDGVHDATRYGSMCAQSAQWTSEFGGSEDCLYLNVVAPADLRSRAAPLPIVAWIHGGSLVMGNASMVGYRVTPAAVARGNFITVGFNYRLNAFGFLATEALVDESATGAAGNYGLMDQVRPSKPRAGAQLLVVSCSSSRSSAVARRREAARLGPHAPRHRDRSS